MVCTFTSQMCQQEGDRNGRGSVDVSESVQALFSLRYITSGSRGPWGPGPPAPRFFSKSCSFQAMCSKFWSQPPPGVKPPLGPPPWPKSWIRPCTSTTDANCARKQRLRHLDRWRHPPSCVLPLLTLALLVRLLDTQLLFGASPERENAVLRQADLRIDKEGTTYDLEPGLISWTNAQTYEDHGCEWSGFFTNTCKPFAKCGETNLPRGLQEPNDRDFYQF